MYTQTQTRFVSKWFMQKNNNNNHHEIHFIWYLIFKIKLNSDDGDDDGLECYLGKYKKVKNIVCVSEKEETKIKEIGENFFELLLSTTFFCFY